MNFSSRAATGIKPSPPIAILPIGTGNDLARTLGWGHKYTDESLQRLLHNLSGAAVVRLDRWDLSCTPGAPAPEVLDENGEETVQSADQPPLPVFNNYFSIGADAQVALEFHESRQANPERFTSRWYNMMFYAGKQGQVCELIIISPLYVVLLFPLCVVNGFRSSPCATSVSLKFCSTQ